MCENKLVPLTVPITLYKHVFDVWESFSKLYHLYPRISKKDPAKANIESFKSLKTVIDEINDKQDKKFLFETKCLQVYFIEYWMDTFFKRLHYYDA